MIVKGQFVQKLTDHGYTLLEMLVGLTIFLTLIGLTPSLFLVIFSTDRTSFQNQEITLFFEQTDKEIQGSIDVEGLSRKLVLRQVDGSIVTYEQLGNRIVRKVDGRGYEIILQNITDYQVSVSSSQVTTRVRYGDRQFKQMSILIQPLMRRGT